MILLSLLFKYFFFTHLFLKIIIFKKYVVHFKKLNMHSPYIFLKKNNLKKILLVFFILITQNTFIISQNEPTPERIPVVKKSEVKNFNLEKGIYDHAFQLTNGKKWDIKISIPEIKPDKKVPLIIALHWAGGGDTYQEFADCLAFPAADTMNAIIIAPSAEGKRWTDASIEKRVITLIKQVKKKWPIDPNKIIVTGYSNGGIGTWAYAVKHPKLFCAAIPMAGFYSEDKVKIPVFVIHGEEDELFNKDEIISLLKKSMKKGSKIEYDVLPKFSHYMACEYTEALRSKLLKVKNKIWVTKD